MSNEIIKRAKEVLNIEAESIKQQIKHLNKDFTDSVDLISKCTGRVVVMGIGKSGLIGRKIAASMSSVGIPAIFVHPAECLHGDLGMIMNNDIVIFLSYTGQTDEIKKLIPIIKRIGVKIIVMTGRADAKAWNIADCIINTKVKKEACSYNIIPTASTTAMLALGDAVSLCASEKKGFGREQLANFHPGGGIGKKLTIKVKDIMHSGKSNPVIRENRTVNEALLVMTRTRLGATSIVNAKGALIGFFTDGDLRRKLQKDKLLLTRQISRVMTRSPRTIHPELLAVDAAAILKKHNFDNIPVIDSKGKPVGILDERDLLAEGIVE
jgi:arabinose-5-phosphate isomerase